MHQAPELAVLRENPVGTPEPLRGTSFHCPCSELSDSKHHGAQPDEQNLGKRSRLTRFVPAFAADFCTTEKRTLKMVSNCTVSITSGVKEAFIVFLGLYFINAIYLQYVKTLFIWNSFQISNDLKTHFKMYLCNQGPVLSSLCIFSLILFLI